VTEIIERGYGKTFYFHDPNGIRLQIEVKPFLDTYRTMCLVPQPEFRRVLDEIREMRMAA
jgi:hypothetical protein